MWLFLGGLSPPNHFFFSTSPCRVKRPPGRVIKVYPNVKQTNVTGPHLHFHSSLQPPHWYQCVAWTPATCDPLRKNGPIREETFWELEGQFKRIQVLRKRTKARRIFLSHVPKSQSTACKSVGFVDVRALYLKSQKDTDLKIE